MFAPLEVTTNCPTFATPDVRRFPPVIFPTAVMTPVTATFAMFALPPTRNAPLVSKLPAAISPPAEIVPLAPKFPMLLLPVTDNPCNAKILAFALTELLVILKMFAEPPTDMKMSELARMLILVLPFARPCVATTFPATTIPSGVTLRTFAVPSTVKLISLLGVTNTLLLPLMIEDPADTVKLLNK